MEKRVLTSHLPNDLAKKLDSLAERLDRPKEWIVKKAIASYVDLDKQRRRLTLAALADVKAGRTHDHAAIEAWAATLGAPKHNITR